MKTEKSPLHTQISEMSTRNFNEDHLLKNTKLPEYFYDETGEAFALVPRTVSNNHSEDLIEDLYSQGTSLGTKSLTIFGVQSTLEQLAHDLIKKHGAYVSLNFLSDTCPAECWKQKKYVESNIEVSCDYELSKDDLSDVCEIIGREMLSQFDAEHLNLYQRYFELNKHPFLESIQYRSKAIARKNGKIVGCFFWQKTKFLGQIDSLFLTAWVDLDLCSSERAFLHKSFFLNLSSIEAIPSLWVVHALNTKSVNFVKKNPAFYLSSLKFVNALNF